MKKSISMLFVAATLVTAAQAQFKRPVKSGTPVKTMPVQVNTQPKMTGTILTPVAVSGANFNDPSTQFTLPDGRRISMTVKKNIPNLPSNIGGVVRENVSSAHRETSGTDNCLVETKTISATSPSFMNVNYNQQSINIFPGAIYRFSDFFGGNFRNYEQGRNPINISTDNLANSTGSVFKTVQNPTGENIRQEIANIIRPFSTTTGSAGIQYRIFTSENDADLSLKLSAGGGYAGFKASAGINTQQTEKRYYLTIDAIKPLYTLTTSIPANGFFSDKSIPANLANSNLMVIKSVTYGTRVLANLEVTVATQKDEIDFKASFGADSGKSVSMNFSAMFNYLKSTKSASSTANVYVVGGPLNVTLMEKDKLEAQITDLISRCNYQTAQPIAYSFIDIDGNVLGIQSATDQFMTRKCTPAASVYKLINAQVRIMTGDDNKEQGSNAILELVNSRGAHIMENNNNNIEFRSQNEITLNRRSNIPENDMATAAFSNGGYLDVFFEPKQIVFGFDAWKIRSVQITLTFQDQTGAQDVKQINFDNAQALLQKNQQRLRLPFNGLFNAGGPFMPGL